MKKEHLLAILVVFVIVVWWSIRPKDIAVIVTDINKTPYIDISVYMERTDKLLLSGKTNELGIFNSTIQAKRNDIIKIICYKNGYLIKPNTFSKKPSGKSQIIDLFIKAEVAGKEIEFKVKNSIPNIDIYGVNEKGVKKHLGKTDREGVLKAQIKKQDYKEITFKYSLASAKVFSGQGSYLYYSYSFDSIPEKINLKAIPNKELKFYFKSNHDFESVGLSNAHVSSEHTPESGSTDKHGMAQIFIYPTLLDGPFIGDVIKWTVKKDNFSTPEAVESKISVGVFAYPNMAEADPYTFTLRREYKMSIQVLEENSPVSNVEIHVNGKIYSKTDRTGIVKYKYYIQDINKKIQFEVKKEGVFAESQTITLGKIEKSITFDVESIHLFLKLLDSKTNDPISNLQISRDGREIGEPVSMGRVKLIFPKTGDYTLKIIDPNKEYLEKTFSLNISQRTIGKEYKVEIDLKTGISFSIVDKTTGIALKGVHVFRDKKEVGKTNSLGHYAEDFDPDPRKYFDYSFKSDHYMSVDNKKIYRNPGRQTDNVELTKLTSNILLIDGKGNFAPYVDVLISNKKVGETDGAGEYEFSPKSIGETFSMKFVSPGELYIPTKRTFKFVRNEQQESIAISRQPWIELKLIEPGGFTLPNVKVISSTGQTGHSDTLGIFRYKVLDKFENVVFSFTQPGFEKISKEISSVDLVTKEDIVIPRLQAYFYVYDSRTNQPVKDLQISVNGYPQTRTDFNGKANIFPNEKPSDLDIYIDAPDDSYIPVSNKVKYTENKLGKFLIDPRPIDINVFVRWSTGSPIKGSIEIDIPYEKYILKQEDRGRHTFQSYNRLIKPTLTITTQTPTGQPLINDFPITIPNQGIFSVDVPIVISKMPTINILVDEGVKLKIIQRTISGDSSIFISDHDGNYKGELPDFGGYTIIRSGSGFRKPDSKFFIIEKVEQTLNLRVKPNCQDAKAFFENRNWTNFIKKVDQLTQNDECYCEMNKKAGEVSMEHLNAYANALEYYNNIIYKSCVIDDINPEIDPYIHLRMLECSVESKQYNEGIREAEKFDGLVHLLKQNNKAQSICNKNYLLGLLMIEEYWRLCDEKSRASYNVANKIKKEVDELGKKIKDHLEMYEKTRGSCSSLQVQLNQIGGGCK